MASDKCENERELLKSKLRFRNFNEDFHAVWSEPKKYIFKGKQKVIAEQDFVIDEYMKKGKVELIVDATRRDQFDSSSRSHVLAGLIISQDKPHLLEKMYTNYVRVALSEYFMHLADEIYLRKLEEQGERELFAEEDKDDALSKFWMNNALSAYSELISYLEKMKLPERVAHFEEERRRFERGSFKKPLGKPDTRKVDEKVFWSIIGETKTITGNTTDQIVLIGEKLEGFNGAGIQSFANHYAKKMRALYHWNAWALGYAALGGCSDDAFNEFRTWLIMQGDPELLELAIENPAKAAVHISANFELPSISVLSIIDKAHLARTGKLSKPKKTALSNLKGEEWEEDKFAEIYPELNFHFKLNT